MRFTILCAPGGEPGEARSRASAIVAVDGPAEVAAAAAASRDTYVVLLASGARPLPGAFGGVAAALEGQPGVLAGATVSGAQRHFGWMLAPERIGPLRFSLAPIVAGTAEAGVDALVRGPIDVAAPGMLIVRRELLLAPLPGEPVAALLELCARARAAGRAVVCRPSFACAAPPLDGDDRGRVTALRAVAESRPELRGTFRMPPAMRRRAVERIIRLPGGRRVRARLAMPPIAVLVHGDGAARAAARAQRLLPSVASARAVDEPAAALRVEMQVRGDRYVLVTRASQLPDVEALERLVEAVEDSPFVAIAAPDAGALDGRCVLVAAARFPQHVEAAGESIAAAIGSLVSACAALGREVSAPGLGFGGLPPRPVRQASAVFLASSLPEISRMSLDAVLAGLRPGETATAALGEHAQTSRMLLTAHPQVRTEGDAADPLLTAAVNRALGAADGDVVFLVADDVLLSSGTLERLRTAFDRIPGLGAAFPSVPGAAGGEGVLDASYADLAQMRAMAETRARTRAREVEPIDTATTPAFAVARNALAAVGGIDPAYGPTRRGIADLTLRLRAAGYLVVRCEDALVHRFTPVQSRNPAAMMDDGQPPPAAPAPAAIAAGFDPSTRVPFAVAAGDPGTPRPGSVSHAIAVPIASPEELDRAVEFVAAAAAVFDAAAPVRVYLALDGTVQGSEVAARLRPVLAAGGVALDRTIAVRVERVDDLAAWRAGFPAAVRFVAAAGFARPALAGAPAINAKSLRSLLAEVTA